MPANPHRLTPEEFMDAVIEHTRCGSDVIELGNWASVHAANLIETLRKEQRDHRRALDALRCLSTAVTAAATFLREAAEVAAALSKVPVDRFTKPLRDKLFASARKCGPVLLGQLAAGQAAALTDDPDERVKMARANVVQLLGSNLPTWEFTDENLTVPEISDIN